MDIKQKNKKRVDREEKNQNNISTINKSLREQGGKIKKIDAIGEKLRKNKLLKTVTTASAKLDKKRFGFVAAVVLFVILLFAIIMPATRKAEYMEAYQVYVNDVSIGAVADTASIENIIADIYAKSQTYYGMEVDKDYKITYSKVLINEQFICPPQYYEVVFSNNIEVKVIAWVIFVNNAPVVALDSRADAQWILEQLLAPYRDDIAVSNRFDIGFLENVEIKSVSISYDKVQNAETALKILQYGDDIDVLKHKVVSGESLYSIGKSYNLRLADIKKANPFLPKNGKIYKNDLLIVTKINNIVNIKYTEYVQRQEEMPYETVIIKDDTMYKTQTKVQQTGVVGIRAITANVVYINGSELTYEILTADTPTKEPINEILIKGTKEVPNVLILAKEGKMPLPLSSYRITSRFGKRDTGIDGASTFHNGVDLAAPYGTPIYASEDGQVSFAGSNGGYGLMIEIEHGGTVETRYGHCSTLLVRRNQYVKRGEIIALVGSTGTSSGNHVHFEVRINGKAVDPFG